MRLSKNNSTYRLQWLNSILLVLLPILLVCALLCGYSAYAIEKTTVTESQKSTVSLQENLDIRFSELVHLTESLELSNTHKNLKKLDDLPDVITDEFYRFSTQMQQHALSNELIDGIYVYYPKIDLVVGNLGCYPSRSYYVLQGIPHRNGYESWVETLQSVVPCRLVMLEYATRNQLCFIQHSSKADKLSAVIVVEIDQNELERIMKSSLLPGDSSSWIILSGVPVMHAGEDETAEDISTFFHQCISIGKSKLEYGGKYIFCNTSTFPDTHYLSVHSASQMLQTVNTFLTVYLLALLACACGSIVLAVRLTRKNSIPLMQLVNKVASSDYIGDVSEYEIISRKIDQLMTAKYNSEKKMLEYQSRLNGMFFNAILYGKVESESDIFDIAQHYGVSFEFSNYQVVILRTDDETPPRVSELAYLQKLFETNSITAFITICDNSYVILLNIDDGVTQKDIKYMTCDAMDKLFPNLAVQACIGPCYDNTTDISNSYFCARSILQNTSGSKQRPVLLYNEVLQATDDQREFLELFRESLNRGQYKNALDLTEELFSGYLIDGDANSEHYYLRQLWVSEILLDVARSSLSQNDFAEIQELLTAPLEKSDVLQCINTMIMGSTYSKKRNVVEQAKVIIAQEYANPTLGLYFIAESLGVSNSYLSNAFKTVAGIGIIQYINQLRIDHAKELILNTDKSIKEIAVMVGFSSDINFIRVFKKFEDCTPSSLRK